MRKADIGNAIDSLGNDVRAHVRDLVSQYRKFSDQSFAPTLMKQALDTPHRAQAQIAAWIADYETRNGAGTAAAFLSSCLTAAGSAKTLAQVNADLAALVSQAATLVSNVQTKGWLWDRVATAIETQVNPTAEERFSYAELPIPDGYTTVFGEPW